MNTAQQRSAKRRLFVTCLLSTVVFAVLCHGYRYLNAAYSGDATLIFQAGEEAYQISLGRFLQPVWWRIRGVIVMPYLIGLFTAAFLSLSAVLICRMFSLRKTLHVILVCGVLTASETFGIANATYLPWSDVYAVALFWALLGASLSLKSGKHCWLAPLAYLISLGHYQSYIACAAAIIVIRLLCDALREPDQLSLIWGRGLRACLHLLAGLLLYALVLKIILSAFGITASGDYNGVGRVGLVSLPELLSLLRDAWLLPLRFLFNPSDKGIIPWHISMIPTGLNLAFALIILLLTFFHRQQTLLSRLTVLFLLAILPIASNFVMVISKGVVNGLMIYAWSFLYLIPLVLAAISNSPPPLKRILTAAAAILCCALIFVNVSVCNQIYVKRDLEYDATHAAFTRILARAEEEEGYVPCETPVVLIGMLPSSPVSMTRSGMDALSKLQGMRYTYSASYETSQQWYLSMILGAPLRLAAGAERSALLKAAPEAASMPAFPADGSITMYGGALFIHF